MSINMPKMYYIPGNWIFDSDKVISMLQKIDNLLNAHFDRVDPEFLYNIREDIVSKKMYHANTEFTVDEIIQRIEDQDDPDSFFNRLNYNDI
jgi:DNA-binding phage protein